MPPEMPGAGLLFHAYYPYRENLEPIESTAITGALFRFFWSQIETKEGEYDWSYVEDLIRPWVDGGKKVALRLFWSAGPWADPWTRKLTPEWVYEKGAASAYSEPAGMRVPLKWDPIYLESAKRFLEEFARRWDGDPNVLFIDLTPGCEMNPYSLELNVRDADFRDKYISTLASDGRAYSDELWLETAKQFIGMGTDAFKKTPLLLTLGPGSVYENHDQSIEVGDYAAKKKWYIGQNGLNGDSYRRDGRRRRAFAAWDATTKFFFEMVAPANKNNVERSGVTQNVGSLMDIMKAAERIHCSYLCVDGGDVLKALPGRADYDPEYAAALEYGAAVIGRPVVIPSGRDTTMGRNVFTYEQTDTLKRLEALYEESQNAGTRTGRFVHYMKADTDGSIQPLGMFVPETYDKNKKYPLIVQLHGIDPKTIAGRRLDWEGPIGEHFILPGADIVYAFVYARGNTFYQGIGEAEVLQAYEEAQRLYSIDPNRIYLMGFSMGGAGAFNIALHYPDKFAALLPIDSALGAGLGTSIPWMAPQTERYNPLLFPGNALDLPTYIKTSGGGLKSAQQEMYELMQEAECRTATIKVHEGMPHYFAPQIPFHTFIPEMLGDVRDQYPEKVSFKTNSLRYNKAYWAVIDEIETPGDFAALDARWDDATLRVQTENAARVSLDLSKAPVQAAIAIDDQELKVAAGREDCRLSKADGIWQFEDAPPPPGAKKHGVQGPIGDALTGPFLIVYGNDEDLTMAQAETDAIRNPLNSRMCVQGEFPYKKADELTTEDWTSYNLLLFGTAETNAAIAAMNAGSFIQPAADGVRAGEENYPGASAAFIAPNPKNPDRYVVVWSGRLLNSSLLTADRDRLGIQSLPDYVIFNDKEIIRAGLFNNDWSF